MQGGGGGKGYVLKTVSYGQASPQDPTTYFLYTIFERKSTPPLSYIFYWQIVPPSHT